MPVVRDNRGTTVGQPFLNSCDMLHNASSAQ